MKYFPQHLEPEDDPRRAREIARWKMENQRRTAPWEDRESIERHRQDLEKEPKDS